MTEEIEFDSNCEYRMATMDGFLSEMANNPASQGYIVIYWAMDSGWLPKSYERLFREHLKMRSFDASRVTIVHGTMQPEPTIQFWVVPPGADAPVVKEENRAVTGPPPEVPTLPKPWNFSEKYPDGCVSGELFLDGYALEADAATRGSVRIFAPTLAAYQELRKKITTELAGYGIPATRLRFTYTKNRYETGANLWVLPGRRSVRR